MIPVFQKELKGQKFTVSKNNKAKFIGYTH
jgi:hypothetical protein